VIAAIAEVVTAATVPGAVHRPPPAAALQQDSHADTAIPSELIR
jgi:hypothetical protein